VNQARFSREFVARAQREGLAYNLIEAFDQPWKRALEGAMGGYWGVFDSGGDPRFPWQGPIADDPHWWRAAVAAGAAAAAGLFVALWRWRSLAAAVATALAWAFREVLSDDGVRRRCLEESDGTHFPIDLSLEEIC